MFFQYINNFVFIIINNLGIYFGKKIKEQRIFKARKTDMGSFTYYRNHMSKIQKSQKVDKKQKKVENKIDGRVREAKPGIAEL